MQENLIGLEGKAPRFFPGLSIVETEKMFYTKFMLKNETNLTWLEGAQTNGIKKNMSYVINEWSLMSSRLRQEYSRFFDNSLE